MTAELNTEEEILARFHRLRITIGLSASKFGYVTVGTASIIARLEQGKTLRPKTRLLLTEALDTLEREHSIPVPTSGVALTRTEPEHIPTPRNVSPLED